MRRSPPVASPSLPAVLSPRRRGTETATVRPRARLSGGVRIRELAAGEVETLVEDLWLPFAREMAAAESHDALADEATVCEQAVEYRRGRLDDEDVVTYVAERENDGTVTDDELLAYAEAEVRESPPVFERGAECYVHGVYVRPDHRAEGLADDLMARLEAWGRERGCEHATLDVHPGNEAAKALYDDRGYRVLREKLALEL
jgi:ribosomal protein S18 acetylase RimI-like enzyme